MRLVTVAAVSLAACLAAVTLHAAARSLADPAPLVTLDADDVPLATLLARLSRASGVMVRIERDGDRPRSVHLARVPLRAALAVVLEDFNYLLVEEGSGGEPKVALVVVLGATSGSPLRAARGGGEAPPVSATDALQQAALAGDLAALHRALTDADPNVQALALDLLAEHGGRDAIALLVAALRSDQAVVRMRALTLLAASERADEATVMGVLRSAVVDGDPAIRAVALRSLAERGGPLAVDALQRALSNPDAAVRLNTVETIARSLSASLARPLLEQASRDTDDEVRAVARNSLDGGGGNAPAGH